MSDITITKARDAAQDLLDRTEGAAKRLVTTIVETTDRSTDQATEAVNELIAWARRNRERMMADLDELRGELGTRLAPVTVVTKAELAELEARVAETEAKLEKALKAQKAKSPTKKAAAKPKAAT